MSLSRPSIPADFNLRRFAVLCGILVALLACWNCRAVLGYQLLAWDDDINITFNPYLGPLNGARLHWMFTDADYMRRYLPIGWLGLSSVHAVYGIDSFGYHAANLALHTINSVLLFTVILLVLKRSSSAGGTAGSVGCAVIAAASWALHPFRAETVGWASGQLYALGAMFGLLAMLVRCGIRENTLPRRSLVTLLYLISLLTYPVTLGLVVVFLLLDWDELSKAEPNGMRRSRTRILAKAVRGNFWMLLAALMSVGGTVIARYSSSDFWTPAAAVESAGIWERGVRGICAAVYYPWRFFWPTNLTPAPTDYFSFNPAGILAIASITVAAGISHFVCWKFPKRKGPFVFWFGYLALLIPFVGLTENVYFPCDRYAYIPTMLFAVAIAVALNEVRTRWRGPLIALTGLVVAAFGFLQRGQLSVWQDTDALYRRITSVTENREYRTFVYQKWMMYHAQRGELEAAQAVFDEARKAVPGNWRLEKMSAALGRYSFAKARGWPETEGVSLTANMHLEAATNFVRRGYVKAASQHFSTAMSLAPESAAIRYNFCVFRALSGQADDALHLFFGLRRASANVSASAQRRALSLIAEAFFEEKRIEPACRVVELALRQPGSDAETAALRERLTKYRGAE